MAQKHIFIICGEPSGDLNAAALAEKIRARSPEIRISGVGGTLSRQAGVSLFSDIKDFGAIGLFDVLKKLPRFFALKDLILQKIQEEKPDALILVDFSGFNLRLARAVNKSLPVIYYISPQVWASRPGRVKTIQAYIHKMIVLFKFEEEFYRSRGVAADFVGHPLLDIARPTMSKKDFLSGLKFSDAKPTIALLPGSRQQELQHILPVMLESARLIRAKLPDAQFIVAKPLQLGWELYDRAIKDTGLEIKVAEGKTYDCLNVADFCLVASGTATLETAIMQKPFFVVYKMNLLNYLLYLPQVRVPCIGMVNIVAGKKIIPEFIQFGARPKKIAQEAIAILNSPGEKERMRQDLASVKASLGEKGASERAAAIIIDFLKNN